jgi:hypothetical protein
MTLTLISEYTAYDEAQLDTHTTHVIVDTLSPQVRDLLGTYANANAVQLKIYLGADGTTGLLMSGRKHAVMRVFGYACGCQATLDMEEHRHA